VALRSLKGGEQKVMPLAEAVALIKADATPPDLR
jgi:threonyl-tRNA synthetase